MKIKKNLAQQIQIQDFAFKSNFFNTHQSVREKGGCNTDSFKIPWEGDDEDTEIIFFMLERSALMLFSSNAKLIPISK